MSETSLTTTTSSKMLDEFKKLSTDDKILLNETINDISEILIDANVSAHERVGELILSKIFKNNTESAWEINDKTSKSPKSSLFKLLAGISDKNTGTIKLPKKTWLYNAINLVLDKRLLEDYAGYDFYKSLTNSVKIEILKVKSIKKKKEIIEKIINDELSVRAARIAIGDLKPDAQPGLISCIKDPTRIIDVNTIVLPDKDDKKKTAIDLAGERVKAIEEELDRKTKGLQALKTLLDRLNNRTEAQE